MSIQRSEGITPSEQYLKKLCDRAFLSLWSYPNVYRDQGPSGQGKELCDLLVVFENHIIIFSDRYVKFPASGDIKLDWGRWFKRAVYASAKQIYGAERWIKFFPERLYLDKRCTQPFPIKLPNPTSSIKFHRIVIAHGVAQRCRKYFKGGSGSLLIDNTIVGEEHFSENCQPFFIGQINPEKGYVHVFDDVTLNVILGKLDTITDFVEYLSKKEVFLSNKKTKLIFPGEEELLAIYFQKLGEDGTHDFILPKENMDLAFFEEGSWEDFLESPQFQSQFEANRISYTWDRLIETFNRNIFGGTQHYAFPQSFNEQEKIIRFLAREPRTSRRMLAKALIDLLEKTPSDQFSLRVVTTSQDEGLYYVFMLFPHYKEYDQEKYRTTRREVLSNYCLVTKLKFPNAKHIIGFATDSGLKPNRSEDLVYFDAKNWTEEDKKEAEVLSDEFGLLKTVRKFGDTEFEFPIDKRKRKKSRKRHRPKRR